MGCDIHTYCEKLIDGKWEHVLGGCPYEGTVKGMELFDWRSYSIFGFLGNVRNHSCCEPLSKNRGLPENVSDTVKYARESWGIDGHSTSFITLKEFLDFDYDKTFTDKRDCNEIVSYREFLGDGFFRELEKMKAIGSPEEVRLVFWFDN